jgi:hypothetical protein
MLYKLLKNQVIVYLFTVASLILLTLGERELAIGCILIGLSFDLLIAWTDENFKILQSMILLTAVNQFARFTILLFSTAGDFSELSVLLIWVFFSFQTLVTVLQLLMLYSGRAVDSIPLYNFTADSGGSFVNYVVKGLLAVKKYTRYWSKLRLVPEFFVVGLLFSGLETLWLYGFVFIPAVMLGFIGLKIYKAYLLVSSNKYSDEIKRSNLFNAKIIVHVNGADNTSYQINQWLPVLELLPFSVVIVFRNLNLIEGFYKTNLPVVYLKTITSVESIIGPDTRAILYPSNTVKNFALFRFKQLQHIFINHGESDKSVNVSKILRAYDRLYLAGPLASDRLESAGITIPSQNIAYVGRPQLELSLERKPKANGEQLTVLYAPTWEGFADDADYTSVGIMGVELVKVLCESYRVIFKPHPYTGSVKPKLKNYCEEIKHIVSKSGGSVEIKTDIHDLMNQSDILVSDISSVMNDYLFTEKPFIVTNPHKIALDVFEESYPTARAGNIISSTADLDMVLSSIIKFDPKKADREDMKKYSLGQFKNGSLHRFTEQLSLDVGCSANEVEV